MGCGRDPLRENGNSSFERHSQSMEERATLDRYHHFHGFSSLPVSLLIPALWGLSQKTFVACVAKTTETDIIFRPKLTLTRK